MSKNKLSLAGAGQTSVSVSTPGPERGSATEAIHLPLLDDEPHSQPFTGDVEFRRQPLRAGRVPIQISDPPPALRDLLRPPIGVIRSFDAIERRPGQTAHPVLERIERQLIP